MRGIAPRCHGMTIPIFQDVDDSSPPTCSQSHLALAINKAVDAGANIINVSAGELAEISDVGPKLQTAVQRCADSEVLIVAAAGNMHGDCRLHIPAALSSVLAVGVAKDKDIDSSQEDEVHSSCDIENYMLAPGTEILGAIPGGATDSRSGSSFAAAVVSGVSALLLSLQLKIAGRLSLKTVHDALFASPGTVTPHEKENSPKCLNVPDSVSHLKQSYGISGDNRTRELAVGLHLHDVVLPETGWAIQQKALEDKYGIVSPEKFGTTEIVLPDGRSYNVPDLHYPTGGGEVGMRLLPVSDSSPIVLSEGTILPGHELVDGWLRQQMELADDEPIFAILSYIVAYDHSTTFFELPSKKLKLAHQHLGVYAGKGRTTHALSPTAIAHWQGANLLNMKWNTDRYPANIQVVSLSGVPQGTINKNGLIVDTILTATSNIPVEHETINCRIIDLNTTLQFYRDKIRDADYLEDLSWFTNCSVHKTIVVNVTLNLPHNESAFCEIFGEDGSSLWHDFRRKYEEITGRSFDTSDETHFTPLWRLEGLAAGDIEPLTVREYHAFYAAKVENRLEDCSGRVPLPVGVGLAWPPETVVDVVKSLMGTYLDFDKLKAREISAFILSLRHAVRARVGIPDEVFLKLVSPVLEDIYFRESIIEGGDGTWFSSAATDLYELTKGFDNQVPVPSDPLLRHTIASCIDNVKSRLDDSKDSVNRAEHNVNTLEGTITAITDKMKAALATSNKTQYFSSPSIIHKIALGIHPKSNFVAIHTVCTAMDSRELEEIDHSQSQHSNDSSQLWEGLLASIAANEPDTVRKEKDMAGNEATSSDRDLEATGVQLSQDLLMTLRL